MPHRPVKRAPDNITFAEIEQIASDEEACLALFERLRFPGGLRCAACDASEAAGHRFSRHRSRRGLFTCGACRGQFTLTPGTAMHRTRLSLSQWLRAIWLIAASSKGISARKLFEMLGITYKVAWHLGHRIRAKMANESVAPPGIVEMDEISAGAPPRRPHGGGPSGVKSGRGPRRPLVLTMVERDGLVIFQRIASHSIAAILGASHNRLAGDAVISTDALPAYRKAVSRREHITVKHPADEFVRRDAGGPGVDPHTNTAEAVHAEIRRVVIGVWHWISPRHLDRYLDEISWRHNGRDVGHARRAGPPPAAALSSPEPMDRSKAGDDQRLGRHKPRATLGRHPWHAARDRKEWQAEADPGHHPDPAQELRLVRGAGRRDREDHPTYRVRCRPQPPGRAGRRCGL